ncbi:hypothetical protein [Paraburkholderia sp.]|jgi:hypothetical protein|nr:hypothetical protein [Paraburkholderia sp.]
MSHITTTSTPAASSLFARIAAVARHALQLHLQTCAIIAEAHRRPN